MSRFMQIDLKLLPLYGSGGLRHAFPNLASWLKACGRDRLLREEPPLYQLVEGLERLATDPAVPAATKAGLMRLLPRFSRVRDEAREHLLSYRLKDLDACLYRLEDLFQDLEKELEW